jgi:hypothetical protein
MGAIHDVYSDQNVARSRCVSTSSYDAVESPLVTSLGHGVNGEHPSHDAQKTLTDLRDHLARHDKPTAFLFGAGTSCSVRVPVGDAGTTEIPAVLGLTAACRKDCADLGNEYVKAWASMEAQCVEAKQDPHVENILSRLRMMLSAIGKDDTLSGLKMDQLAKLEECVRKTIARLVTPDLKVLPADFPHRKLARWLARTSRKASAMPAVASAKRSLKRSMMLSSSQPTTGRITAFSPLPAFCGAVLFDDAGSYAPQYVGKLGQLRKNARSVPLVKSGLHGQI